MLSRDYWTNYYKSIKLGKSIEGVFTNDVEFDFHLPEQLNTWSKGNLNNAKILLLSIIREIFFEHELPFSLSLSIDSQCLPIDTCGNGDFRVGAKKLLEDFRSHLLHIDSFFLIESRGLLVTDESSKTNGKETIVFTISDNLNTIKVFCRNELQQFVRALSQIIISKINSDVKIDSTDFSIYVSELLSVSADVASKRRILVEQTWQEIFQKPIEWQKNYYSNGGDSIQAIRLLSKLKEKNAIVDLSGLLNAYSLEYWVFESGGNRLLSNSDKNSSPKRYPLSDMQVKVWNHYQSFKTHGAYHEQFLFEIKRFSGVEIIRECIDAIWKSYDQLRVRIDDKDGVLYQEIMDDIPVSFIEASFENINEAIEADLSTYFENTLLRVTIFTVQNKTYLLWSHHHVILDGWSVGILIREFVHRISVRNQTVIQQPNYQYRLLEYEKGLSSSVINKEVLNPYLFPLYQYQLPATFQTISYDRLDVDFSKEAALINNLQITRQLLCCGLIGLVIGAVNSEKKFYFNGISSGRDFLEGEIDSAVGLFIRNIQIPIVYNEANTWEDFYKYLQSRFTELLSMDRQVSLDDANASNSDFLFIYENYPYNHLYSEEFEAELVHVNEITGYPVTFCLFPLVDGYALRIAYDARRFSAEWIAGIKTKFEQIYHHVLNSPIDALIDTSMNFPIIEAPDACALDKLSLEDLKVISSNSLRVQCHQGQVWSDLFKDVAFLPSEVPLEKESLNFWANQLYSELPGVWTDIFDTENKRFALERISVEGDEVSLLVCLVKFMKKEIWRNSGFQIICGKGGLLFPIVIQKETNETDLADVIEEQLLNGIKYREIFLELLYSDWSPESNFLISFDEFPDQQKNINFDLILTKNETGLEITYSQAISSMFVHQLKTEFIDVREEQEHSSNRWSIISSDITDESGLRHFLDDFEYHVESSPNLCAVEDSDKKLTYSELDIYATNLAIWLTTNYHLEKEKFIGICLKRSAHQLAVVLAVLKLGKAFVPIDYNWPERRVEQIRSQVDLTLIVDQDLVNRAIVASKISNQYIKQQRSLDSSAYVLFTSGSTGIPKGCLVSHASLANYLAHCRQEYFDKINQSRVHVFTPLTFDFTLTSYLGAIANGLTLIIHPEEENAYDSLREALEDNNSFLLKITPSHIQLAEREWFFSASPKKFIVGGEALDLGHVEKCLGGTQHVLINEYGPTEATVGCAFQYVEINQMPFVGYPINRMGLMVLDENMEIVRRGCEGELYLFGVGLAVGYLSNDLVTNKSFVHRAEDEHTRLYKTGDLVKMQIDGRLLCLSRIDEQVKINGYRIEIEEIRLVIKELFKLDSHTLVVEIEGSKQLVCFLVGDMEQSILKAAISDKLPAYMVPHVFFSVPGLLITPNGKLDTKSLLNKYLDSGIKMNKNTYQEPINLKSALQGWLNASPSIRKGFPANHIRKFGWQKTNQQIAYLEQLLAKQYPILFPQSVQDQWSQLIVQKKQPNTNNNEDKFIIASDLEISSRQLLDFSAVLKENSVLLPETYGSVLSKTINGFNNTKNISKEITSNELKFLEVGEIVTVGDWSEDINFPFLVAKKNDGNLIWLSPFGTELKIKDFLGYENPLGWSGIINFISSQQYIFKKTEDSISLIPLNLIERFSHKISLHMIELVVYENLSGILCAFAMPFKSKIYLFIKSKTKYEKRDVESVFSKNLPPWCQPDEICFTNDLAKEVEDITRNINNELTDSFSLFLSKNLPEYTYLQGKYSLIEQGGDSITALRIVGKLKAKGYNLEVGSLLNANNLDDYFSKIVSMGPSSIESDAIQLTPIQQWFLTDYKGNKNHYNQSILLEILIPVESSVILTALQQTFKNYTILSRLYQDAWVEGIEPNVKLFKCLSDIEITEKCSIIQSSFNLESGPVAGGAVFEKNNQIFLFVCIHHFYCDGYTWRIFLDELQEVLKGRITTQLSSETYGKTRKRFTDLANECSIQSSDFYNKQIQNPFNGWTNYTFSTSKYLEWEWTNEQTRWFQFGDEIGKTVNEKFLFLFIKTWIELKYAPSTIFFETHGRSYTGIPELSETIGWFTQFYPVFNNSWPKLDSLINDIAQQFNDLPQNGLTYMAMDDWFKPPFPILLNFLGNFDEDRGAIAVPSNISQGEMTDTSNPALGIVEVNAMIIEGKMKWMLRMHPDLDPTSFRDTLNGIVAQLISGKKTTDYLVGSIEQSDIDAIDDLLSNL